MRVLDDWLLTVERVIVHLPNKTAVVADALEEAGCRDEQILRQRRGRVLSGMFCRRCAAG
jgi:hypothetical protein